MKYKKLLGVIGVISVPIAMISAVFFYVFYYLLMDYVNAATQSNVHISVEPAITKVLTIFVVSLTLLIAIVIFFAFHLTRFVSILKEPSASNERYAKSDDKVSNLVKFQNDGFKRFVDAFPCGLVILDRTGKVLHHNEQAFFGHRFLKDTPYAQVMKELGITPEKSVIWRSYLEQEALTEALHVRIGTETDDYRTVFVMSQPLFDAHGALDLILAVILDITEQSPLAEQMKTSSNSQLIAELAAAINHEVCNPLTTVRGFTQVLSQRGNMSDHDREAISWILEEVDSAVKVLQDFLGIARTGLKVQRRTVDVQGLLLSISRLMEAQVQRYGAFLKVEIDCRANIYADPNRLRQVILNLLGNAMHALPETGGTIWLRCGLDSGWVTIEVADDGSGIPFEQLDQIGKPFFTTKESGKGLGLATSFQIVEEHQGKMEIVSEEGTGTTVRIRLPVENENLIQKSDSDRPLFHTMQRPGPEE